MNKKYIIDVIDIYIKSKEGNTSHPLDKYEQTNKAKKLKYYIQISDEAKFKELVEAYINADKIALKDVLLTINLAQAVNHSESEQAKLIDIAKNDANTLLSNNTDGRNQLKETIKKHYTNQNSFNDQFFLQDDNSTDPIAHDIKQFVEIKKILKTDLKDGKRLGKSAHAVYKYKDDGNNQYYVKYFDLTNPKQQAQAVLDEMVYANLWRLLAGDFANVSESLFVIDDKKNIIGSASKGLPEFKSYKLLLEKNDFNIPSGFVTVLLLAALLKEQDLHSENIGVSGESDQSQKFSKIDHDYIVSHWKSVKLENNVDLGSLAKALARESLDAFIDNLKSMRFSPVTKNSKPLQLAHMARAHITSRDNTTISSNNVQTLLEHLTESTTGFAELLLINNKYKDYEGIFRQLKQFKDHIIQKMHQFDWCDSKNAIEMLEHLIERVEGFSKKVRLYGMIYDVDSKIKFCDNSQCVDIIEKLNNYKDQLIRNLEDEISNDQINSDELLGNDLNMQQLVRVQRISNTIQPQTTKYELSEIISNLQLKCSLSNETVQGAIDLPVIFFYENGKCEGGPRTAFSNNA
ncbi:hypothetical protein L3V83_13035 [Thiotrichales bacterium 19X7-9]|nr:hypothetical protein [Thiotrichales bacterium 19X7-9]